MQLSGAWLSTTSIFLTTTRRSRSAAAALADDINAEIAMDCKKRLMALAEYIEIHGLIKAHGLLETDHVDMAKAITDEQVEELLAETARLPLRQSAPSAGPCYERTMKRIGEGGQKDERVQGHNAILASKPDEDLFLRR